MMARDTISYSAAISACERGGRWELALLLLRTGLGCWPTLARFGLELSLVQNIESRA